MLHYLARHLVRKRGNFLLVDPFLCHKLVGSFSILFPVESIVMTLRQNNVSGITYLSSKFHTPWCIISI